MWGSSVLAGAGQVLLGYALSSKKYHGTFVYGEVVSVYLFY
jgi:hypothetical protein